MIITKIIKKKQKRLITELRSIFETNNISSKLDILNTKMLEANFWQDKDNSKNTIIEVYKKQNVVDGKVLYSNNDRLGSNNILKFY